MSIYKRPVLVELDVAWDCPLGDFLRWLERHHGSIVGFIGDGPGGGNPCLQLSFESETDWETAEADEDSRAQAVMSIVTSERPADTDVD